MSGTGLGIQHATLIAPDLDFALASYVEQLSMSVVHRDTLDATDAALLGLGDLAGAPVAWLANSSGKPVLRLIADPAASIGEPMFRHGWLSLEVLVGDVDTLAAGLREPFRILGQPANLELSDSIRASQVLGPCGEMLYLTEIKAPVPPFELPMTRETVDVPFIAVQTTPSRDASQRAWRALLGEDGWAFDTKITVLNRAHGKPLEGRYPVAVVPMPGQCMVEIDEIELPPPSTQRPAGFHSLCVRLENIDDTALREHGWKVTASGDRRGLIGPAGEHVEVQLASHEKPA